MHRRILAVTVGIALAAAVLTPALYNNNAFAQVTAESRVLQAILGLTDQIKQQTTEIKGKTSDIILDLGLKKKFYSFENSTSELGISSVFIQVVSCPLDVEEVCAFNIESLQFSGNSVSVTGIEVDGVTTDISEKQIITSTNLLVDSGIGKLGASEQVRLTFFEENFIGDLIVTGEKPQGMELEIILDIT